MAFDLQSAGLGVIVEAPVGAEVRPGPEGVLVRRSPSFAVEIKAQPVDFATRIHAIEHDPLRPLQRFVGDEHDTLVYETASLDGAGLSEYHFITQMQVGDRFYSCEDVRGTRFGLTDVQHMLQACRSVRISPSAALPAPETPPTRDLGPLDERVP